MLEQNPNIQYKIRTFNTKSEHFNTKSEHFNRQSTFLPAKRPQALALNRAIPVSNTQPKSLPKYDRWIRPLDLDFESKRWTTCRPHTPPRPELPFEAGFVDRFRRRFSVRKIQRRCRPSDRRSFLWSHSSEQPQASLRYPAKSEALVDVCIQIIIFNTKSITFNEQSIILNTKFTNFNGNRYRHVKLGRLSPARGNAASQRLPSGYWGERPQAFPHPPSKTQRSRRPPR